MCRITFAVLLALLLVPGVSLLRARAGERPRIVLAADVSTDTPLMKRVQAYYAYLFDKVGCDVEFLYFPSGRGVLEARKGALDGDFFRIAEYG